MLKVVCIVDKVGTALDRLAKGVAPYHSNLEYIVCDVHPKRPDPEQLRRFQEAAMDADIIDAQYYRSLYKLRDMYPWLKDKKTILTHNNPYAIEEQEWNDVDLNVGNNDYITKRLGEITTTPVEYIPLTVNTDFWTYNTEWKPLDDTKNHDNGTVIMVANRIESKKGILPVAIACGDLGLKFILVGAISNMEYFHDIEQTGNVEFYEQVPDEILKELYYKSTVHVCNSVDNFESGTLPILEAMLCGTPVMTRMVGHVPELYNGENLTIYEGDPEDVGAITETLHQMIADKKGLQEQRDKAWNTAKARSFERRAYMYQKLYRQVLYPDQAPVSVIVPIFDKPEIIRECLNAIDNQTYKNLEIIVADDNPDNTLNVQTVKDFGKFTNKPLRYLHTAYHTNDYGLARARNYAVIEATGDYLVFCDQRMIMDKEAVQRFMDKAKPKYWLYGNKGAKKEFVENFSFIKRVDLINGGLFNERINAYGGMSQEVRNRMRMQGVTTEFVENAKATPKGKSSNRNRQRGNIIKMKSKLWKMELE